MTDAVNRALEAFRRLLADGSGGGQAKVDALVALSQRTVVVGLWGSAGTGYRTLVNSNGQAALPVFTSMDQLEEAADRFGWREPDGSLASEEVGARKVIRHVVEQKLPFLVIDIVAPYSLEVECQELEPLLTSDRRSDSEGPFAGVGRISSSMLGRVKPTPPPMAAVTGHEDPSKAPDLSKSSPGLVAATGMTASSAGPAGSGGPKSATFGSGSSVELHPLTEDPPDSLLDALSDFLRGFPEVEWAAYCNASRGPVSPAPTIGLRVDTSYRARVNDIIQGLKGAADTAGATVDVLLLDDAKLMRQARSEQLAFFPWRKKK